MTRAIDTGTKVPAASLLPAALAVMLLVLPLLGLLGNVSWGTFWHDVTSQNALQAVWLSLRTAVLATVLCTLLGVPLALVIARSDPRIAQILRAMVAVPLVLPPMVGGVALLLVFGRTSPIGNLIESWWNITLPFSTTAVVMAQMFVALPFLVLTVEGALRASGAGYEQTAATLGAGPWTVLTRVSLPLAAPGLVAGVMLCFARALGEFGATALFAGNAPGRTQTMPLAIYTAFNGAASGRESAVALSLLLLAAAVLVLCCLRAWRPGALK